MKFKISELFYIFLGEVIDQFNKKRKSKNELKGLAIAFRNKFLLNKRNFTPKEALSQHDLFITRAKRDSSFMDYMNKFSTNKSSEGSPDVRKFKYTNSQTFEIK